MRKPKKEPISIRVRSYLFDTYCDYTPDDLRRVADEMEMTGIHKIEIDYNSYDGTSCYATRIETEEEANKRYKIELKAYEKFQEGRKKRIELDKKKIIKDAKKLGLKVVE